MILNIDYYWHKLNRYCFNKVNHLSISLASNKDLVLKQDLILHNFITDSERIS